MKRFFCLLCFLVIISSCNVKPNFVGNWQSTDNSNSTLSITHLSENLYFIKTYKEWSPGSYSYGKYYGALKNGEIHVEKRKSKIIYLREKDQLLFEDILFKRVIQNSIR